MKIAFCVRGFTFKPSSQKLSSELQLQHSFALQTGCVKRQQLDSSVPRQNFVAGAWLLGNGFSEEKQWTVTKA